MADRPLSVFEHHLHVLDLAFEYLSVDPSQKQKIIELVDKKTQEDENFSILDIFKEESLISDEDMGHLKVFDEHIHALCQDHQFGKIAVANGMASAKDVESALAYQKSQFEKYRINMLIGDILVEKKVISPADRMSVLLTQNRIKDEQLCDALDQIGATIAEKDLINKRFGVLAIKKALEVQLKDHAADFELDRDLYSWMEQWGQEKDDEQVIRGTLGRLLFSQNDINKSVKVISGGEQGRMLFGKLMLQQPNIMLMDEPTNHLDMESIEALNLALENYPGTLFFISHDREFISSLATRVLEIKSDCVIDFKGTYDEYLRSQGIDEVSTARTVRDSY
jgi:ABC-type phosphate/phosphonate transport system ATPase subunit